MQESSAWASTNIDLRPVRLPEARCTFRAGRFHSRSNSSTMKESHNVRICRTTNRYCSNRRDHAGASRIASRVSSRPCQGHRLLGHLSRCTTGAGCEPGGEDICWMCFTNGSRYPIQAFRPATCLSLHLLVHSTPSSLSLEYKCWRWMPRIRAASALLPEARESARRIMRRSKLAMACSSGNSISSVR